MLILVALSLFVLLFYKIDKAAHERNLETLRTTMPSGGGGPPDGGLAAPDDVLMGTVGEAPMSPAA